MAGMRLERLRRQDNLREFGRCWPETGIREITPEKHPATALGSPLGRKTPNASPWGPCHKDGSPTIRPSGFRRELRAIAFADPGRFPLLIRPDLPERDVWLAWSEYVVAHAFRAAQVPVIILERPANSQSEIFGIRGSPTRSAESWDVMRIAMGSGRTR